MQFDAELVLSFFLIFGNFEARCSFKIALIKKCMISLKGKLSNLLLDLQEKRFYNFR